MVPLVDATYTVALAYLVEDKVYFIKEKRKNRKRL